MRRWHDCVGLNDKNVKTNLHHGHLVDEPEPS